MRPYEVAVILDTTLDENVIRQTTDGMVEFVRSRGGNPGRIDRWGRRPFAYEMKHRTEGYYLFLEVSAEPQVLSELDRMLRLSDDVLRHRVIRLPDAGIPVRPSHGPRPVESEPAPASRPVESEPAPASVDA